MSWSHPSRRPGAPKWPCCWFGPLSSAENPYARKAAWGVPGMTSAKTRILGTQNDPKIQNPKNAFLISRLILWYAFPSPAKKRKHWHWWHWSRHEGVLGPLLRQGLSCDTWMSPIRREKKLGLLTVSKKNPRLRCGDITWRLRQSIYPFLLFKINTSRKFPPSPNPSQKCPMACWNPLSSSEFHAMK